MREAKVTQIFEGTNQIQRIVIVMTLCDAEAGSRRARPAYQDEARRLLIIRRRTADGSEGAAMAQQIHEQADRTTRLVGAIIGCPECSGPAEVE